MHVLTLALLTSFIVTSICKTEEDPIKQVEHYIQNGEHKKAIPLCYSILASNPHNINARFCLGNAFCQQKRYELALEQFDFLTQHVPQFTGGIYNKAYVLKSMGRMHEAIPSYEQVLAREPNNHYAHYGFAQALLAVGDFERGWYELQWRMQDPENKMQGPIDPSTLAGKRVLLRVEFGFGDMIQFLRFAKLFKQHGAIVYVQTFKPLVPLFSLCDFIDQVIATGEPAPPFDIAMPMLSTPIVFQTRENTIPADIPYLQADPHLVTEWKQKLAHDKNFKIGICWHAKPHCFLEENPLTARSIPLKLFKPLAQLPHVSLYSLQKKYGEEELKDLPEGMVVHDFGEHFDEDHGCFMDTVAVMKNLDLVISADTSIVHVAGALGVQTWALLPSVAEWRWLQNRTDTPWYPHTMHLFRQQKHGDWQTVIENVVKEVEPLIIEKRLLQYADEQPSEEELINKALALQEQQKYDQALATFDMLLTHHLQSIKGYFHLGNLYFGLKDYEKALEQFDAILAINPNHFTALYNKAYALKSLGRMHEAIPVYEKVIATKPSYNVAHLGLSYALLATGQLKRGWEEYTWRLVPYDPWYQQLKDITPSSLNGKTVLIRAEFSLGDSFHFIRYAQLLKQAGATVIVETYKTLLPLFSQCNYIDQLIEKGDPLPHYDKQIPIMSLPYVFKTTEQTIPKNIPYLYADEQLINKWQDKLAHDTNVKIGICWQSHPDHGPEQNLLTKRSIPLKLFEPLAHISGVSLYSLQKEHGTEQLDTLPQGMTIHAFDSFDKEQGAFMDTAAIMKNLDLVISADTSLVHLAGALGVQTWVVLPSAAEWRWLQKGSHSLWYPTMRLFRQQKQGDWRSVIQTVADEVKKLAPPQSENVSAAHEPEKSLLDHVHKCIKEKDYDHALTYIHKILAINPKNIPARFDFANILGKTNNFEQAIEQYNFVLSKAHTFLPAMHNKAFALKSLGKLQEAKELYEQILAQDPEYHDALYGSAPVYLGTGDFEKGWYAYQWRMVHSKKWIEKLDAINPFVGKKILIKAEFGLGDALQFIRYAQLFKQLGATVILESHKPLVQLFSLCDYIDEVIPQGSAVPETDITIPLMSLPYVFKTSLHTIPAQTSYLKADPNVVKQWHAKLAHDKNFKIGICWQGTYQNQCEQNPLSRRAIPLETFAPLMKLPGVSVYSLQKMDGNDQRNYLPNDCIIHNLGPDFDESHGRFMDTAAAMKNLDLIISVDTAPAHLAGALGVPVWVLLPTVADWRWLQKRTDTPWYPTMRLFRKNENENWEPVIQQVINEVEKLKN